MSSEPDSDVRRRERAFHDAQASSIAPDETAPRPPEELEQAIFDRVGSLAGRDVLDLGCGAGDLTLHALQQGANVTALDLSPRMAETTRGRVAAVQTESRFRVVVAAAETTGLPSDSFDVIIGKWIIHHLDVEAATEEIARLLRPGGTAVFVETSSLNPLLRLARKHLTGRFGIPRFGTSDEHPLEATDYAMFARRFASFQLHAPFFYFFRIADRQLLQRWEWPALRGVARWLDLQVWRWFPRLRRYSYWIVLEARS